MSKNVKKIPYTIDTINYSYDITKTQPQLFVTETFQNLIDVLEQFADTMSFRKGGTESIRKAMDSKNPATAVYSSGLQVTGVFSDMGQNDSGELTFIKTTGPSALSFADRQLDGHGKLYHKDGFSSPVGKLKNTGTALENFSSEELYTFGIIEGNTTELIFESGIQVSGTVKAVYKHGDHVILIAFEDCTVKESNGNILFQPEWGTYDMAVGSSIVSVFNGAADKEAYEEITYISDKQTEKIVYDESTTQLHHIYSTVRKIRAEGSDENELPALFKTLKTSYSHDWLCALEILEIVRYKGTNPGLEQEIRAYLEAKALVEPQHKKLIHDGMHVIENPVTQLITEED